jgi:monoamine oxidase
VEPGAYLDHGEPFAEISLADIVASDFWDGQNQELFAHLQYYWQTSLMQPVGGMDMIWRGFCKQLGLNPDDQTNLRQTVGDLVAWRGRPVTSVRHTTNGVEVHHSDEHGGDVRRETADFCMSTMAPIQLLQVGNGFSTAFVNALADIAYISACKVGWQTTQRFWETDDGIYGGISWTKHIISQIWYPSSGYQSDTGVLTATYNRGPDAVKFGNLALEERFKLAMEGGKKLHPDNYEPHIMRHTALGIAWQNMSHFIGGWPNETFESRPQSYERLNAVNPQERLYLAGDYISYWPGWQEGALTAANCAYGRLHDWLRKS